MAVQGRHWIGVLAIAAMAAEAAAETPPGIESMVFGHGTRLTDSDGRALYTFDTDLGEPGTSTCVDACAELRPPLLAAAVPDDLPDGWSTIMRDDGAQQWALNGQPLYRYVRDRHAGAAYGDGEAWHLVFDPIVTPADVTIADTVMGQVLAAADGKTLYVHNDGEDFICDQTCRQTWQPLQAPWGARASDGFSALTGEDGVSQWAYNGQPLYAFAGDADQGDLNGHGRDGVWQALVLEPAPPVPDWVRVVGSDGGELYADSDGMTLYHFLVDGNAEEGAILGGNHCDAACLDQYWTPVLADADAAPVGYWSVIEHEDGIPQWAYKGMPLYQLTLETRPGQLYYTTFRKFQWMKPIMYRLPALQGVF